MEIDAARLRYRDITGLTAPRHLKKGMLDRLIDWHLHCITAGVASHEAFFYRQASVQSITLPQSSDSSDPAILREWNGTVHVVRRCANGTFRYGDRYFTSLTGVAKAITGTHRSGPAFFGAAKPKCQ